jgi:hypothetical protein
MVHVAFVLNTFVVVVQEEVKVTVSTATVSSEEGEKAESLPLPEA